MYANVLIVENAGNFDQVLTYSIPAGMKAEVGALVLVPVRRQYCKGLILSVREERPALAKIKELKQVFDDVTAVSPMAIELAQWMADYYVCSMQKVLALFLPPPVRIKEKLVYLLHSEKFGEAEEMLLPEQERRILELLRQKGAAGLTNMEIRRRLGHSVEQELANLIDGGFLTVKKLFEPEVTVKEEVIFRLREQKQDKQGMQDIQDNKDKQDRSEKYKQEKQDFSEAQEVERQVELLKRAPRQQAIWHALQEKPYSATELKKEGLYNRSALQALIDKNLIEWCGVGVEREPYRTKTTGTRPDALNAAQEKVFNALRQSLQAISDQRIQDVPRKWLLYGVTGSGKTEVYLHIMEEALALGRQVLYLVPEIALTPQVVALLVAVFGEQVAVLHSALSPGERYDQWRKIREGRATVVLGPRSAVFAPFRRLGLIIIDEEHENTYKQNEPDPRYDARIVAEKMADLTGAILVRGSATPALRSFYAASRGEYGLLKLPERVAARPLPALEIVDMKRERQEGNSSIFSTKLLNALRRTFAAGEQAILFINRRGFHTYVMCRECGKPLVCPHCNITLNYHQTKGQLVCHYCNFVRPLPRNCPFCGSTYVRYYGTGTERVAEEMGRFFPKIPFIRMDTDTTQRKDSHSKMLEAFQTGQAKVLIGTQMIAKGLDFPQVTLVGILNPDFLLNMPDYQAGERVFQLMTQVAGRAGRGEEPGKVLIQTYQPDNYLFNAVLKQDYEEFYRQEMANRQLLQYPPFANLARVLVTGYDERQVRERIQLWAELLKQQQFLFNEKVEILGPGPAPLEFLKKRFRYHIIIKSTELLPLQKLTRLIREKILEYAGDNLRTVIDIEPQSLL